jgi:eukaryotic-like serine/threonine-protein kinase
MKICTSCGSLIPAADEACPQCGARSDGFTGRLTGITLVDKYLIEEPLGSGGMCEVYRARHIAMDKEVAIKILKPELAADPRIAQRFEQEARAASRVRHPHAINVTDYGIGQGNTPFLVMELVEGLTVRELLIQDGPFTIERLVNILHQACGALEVAHSVGVIHRDIKPDNIIISEYDGSDWVEVVDFGVAKIQEDVNRRAALTGANFIIGTPRYMSPEQCEEQPVDARSDIYSLGVVVYEMLAGEAPFEGGSSTRLLMAHVAEPPPPLREKRPDIPPEIEGVVMRALDKNPDRRPQSALEFAREFERAAGFTQPEADADRTGAFSRINVPLAQPDIVPVGASQPLEAIEAEDEETLVRRRISSRSEPLVQGETLDDLSGLSPYKSVAEIEGSDLYRNDLDPPRSASTEPEADPLPSEPDAHDPQVTPPPLRRETNDIGSRNNTGTRNYAIIIGLLLLTVALGFIAYAIFGSRSIPASSSDDKAAQDARPPDARPADAPASGSNTATPAPSNANAAPAAASANKSDSAQPGSATVINKPNPTAAPDEPTEETTKLDTGRVKQQVTRTVYSAWQALESKDLNNHMSYYAPRLRTFYLKSDVDRASARAEIAGAMSPYQSLKFDFNNIEVRVDPSGKSAIATYDKRWDFDGNQRWSGTVRERLWLVNSGGRWLINGVRDLKVY